MDCAFSTVTSHAQQAQPAYCNRSTWSRVADRTSTIPDIGNLEPSKEHDAVRQSAKLPTQLNAKSLRCASLENHPDHALSSVNRMEIAPLASKIAR
jgi:hypothetical protein